MKAKLIVATMTFIAGTSMLAMASDSNKHVNVLHTEGATSIMVNINKENGSDAKVELKIDGKDYSFSLPELADGETREITTDDGQSVTLLKAAKGTTVTIDGKEIMLHSLAGNHGRMANVFAFGSGMGIHQNNTLIISGGGLDDDARARIKEAIAAAGIDKKVIFPETEMNWISDDGENNFEVIIDSDEVADGDKQHVIKIRKHIATDEDQ